MYPRIAQVASDPALPKRADAVVIGGGIVGVSTAYFLAERGLAVVLLDKSGIAHEQSSRNWGWCRTMGRDVAEIPLAIESLKLWESWRDTLEHDTGFVRSGILYACESDAETETQKAWLAQSSSLGSEARLLDRDALAALLPEGVPAGWQAGLWTESDGRAEPDVAFAAIAQGARKLGVKIFVPCAARGLALEGGRVQGVFTELGRIDCDTVVLAGGAWSSLFCRTLGIRLPQLRVLGSVLRTEQLEDAPEFAIATSRYAFRKRADGGYTIALRNANVAPLCPDSFRYFNDFIPLVRAHRHEYRLRVNAHSLAALRTPNRWAVDAPSPFERERLLDPRPIDAYPERALEMIRAQFPAFAKARIAQYWGGMIDVTPDAVPVIDRVAAIPGFHLATGFSGHGFGIGPGAGRLMADMACEAPPLVDPTPYRLARFNG